MLSTYKLINEYPTESGFWNNYSETFGLSYICLSSEEARNFMKGVQNLIYV